MRPLNKKYFGPSNACLSIRFYNGDALVNGYVFRQIGSSRFVASDGIHLFSVNLTPDTTKAKYLTGELAIPNGDYSIVAGIATIPATQNGSTYYLWKLTSKMGHTTSGIVNPWAINSAPNGELLINGVSALVLGDISMSSLNYKSGDAFNVYMRGITPGSTVTATCSDGTSLTVVGQFLRGTFATLGTPTITFVESLPGAVGSPHTSTYQVNVNTTDDLLPLTITPTTALLGKAYFGAVQDKTAGSTIHASSDDGTIMTVYGGMVTGVFLTSGTKTLTLVETLAGQTNSSNVIVTV